MWHMLALMLWLRLALVYLFLEAFKMQNFSCIRLIMLPLPRWKGPCMWQPLSVLRITFRHLESRERSGAHRNLGVKELEKWSWEVILVLALELIVMVQTNFDFSKLKPHTLVLQLKVTVTCLTDPSRRQDQGSDRTELKKNPTKTKPKKTASTAICMANIRPDMTHASVHVCVGWESYTWDSCSQRPCFVRWNM